MTRKLYLAGPMQGYPEFNFPAFEEAARVWRYRGWHVFSPAEHSGPDVERLREYLAQDLLWICKEADAIFMMRGWENSKGAQTEWALARALGLEIFYQD